LILIQESIFFTLNFELNLWGFNFWN